MPTGLGNDSWVNLPTYRDMPLYAMKQSVFSCYMVHLALYVVYIPFSGRTAQLREKTSREIIIVENGSSSMISLFRNDLHTTGLTGRYLYTDIKTKSIQKCCYISV